MTVIAYFASWASPFFISDMLLSSARYAGKENDIWLPTMGDLRQFEVFSGRKLPYVATRMVRKPFSVHGGKVNVAWAGPVRAGEVLYEALVELLAVEANVEDAFEDAFSRLSMDDQREVSVIVAYADEGEDAEHAFKVVHRNCEVFDSPVFGCCYFGGSGAVNLMTWIDQRGRSLARRLENEGLDTLPDAICQKLVFEETLVLKDSPSPFSALLDDGCGGFYESLRLRYPGRQVVPRVTCHLVVRVDDLGSEVTRLTIYFTRLSVGGTPRRMAFIATPRSCPFPIDPSQAPIQHVAYEQVDVVACEPFWDDSLGKEHLHMVLAATDESWVETEVKVEVVALTLLADGVTIPLGAVSSLSDEAQFAAVDEVATRSKSSTTFAAAERALIGFHHSDGHATVGVDLDWLLPLVEAFRSGIDEQHVVIDQRSGFKVLT